MHLLIDNNEIFTLHLCSDISEGWLTFTVPQEGEYMSVQLSMGWFGTANPNLAVGCGFIPVQHIVTHHFCQIFSEEEHDAVNSGA